MNVLSDNINSSISFAESSFQELGKRLRIVTKIHIYSQLCRLPVERVGGEEKALEHYVEPLNKVSQFLKSLRHCGRKPTKHLQSKFSLLKF